MRKSVHNIVVLVAIMVICCHSAHSQQERMNDFGLWTAADFDKKIGERWDASLRLEHRTNEMSQKSSLWFVRPGVGYRATEWLKVALSYDFFHKTSDYQHRILLDVIPTIKSGGLTCSLRERFIVGYSPRHTAWSWLIRSRLTSKYSIKNSPLAVYLAFELYANRQWTMMHNFAGIVIKVDESSSFDIFYMFGLNHAIARQDHVAGVTYQLRL